jgi:precorrin-6A/cobalt-precorrin-6A reductase
VLVLVLGGTAEARALAAALDARPGLRVVSSLAGRVSAPSLPAGEVRIGGFGGVPGLTGWLNEHRAAAVVDATHPFAERISAIAVQACAGTSTPLIRLQRPGWAGRPDAGCWHWVGSLPDAAALLPGLGRRVLLTTGRQGLATFYPLATRVWFLARCVDPPEPSPPAGVEVILDRGPYTLAGELVLLRRHRIDVLVTKDSGGDLTVAKLDAAARLGLPVVVVRRPAEADAASVRTVEAALGWLDELGSPPD